MIAAVVSMLVALAPAVASAQPQPVDRYDWRDTVSGQGTTLSAGQFAERVIQTGPSLDRTQAAAEQAVAAAAEVRTNMLPRLDASLRYTRLFQPDNPSLVAGPSPSDSAAVSGLLAGVDDPEAQALLGGIYDQLNAVSSTGFPVVRNQYALRLQASYPVSDVFATVLPAYREAKAGAEANRAMEEAQRAELRLRAHEAYFGYVRARSLAAVAQVGVQRAQSQYDIVEASRKLGAATQADALRARARLAQARISDESARAGVDTSHEVLRTLAHMDAGTSIAVPRGVLSPAPVLNVELDTLQDRGERRRPELAAAKKLIESRTQRVKRTRGEMAPKLVVVGGMDTARPNPRLVPLTDEFNTTFDVSAVLSWSPNQLITGRRRKQQADASLRQARADKRELTDGVRIEVATAYFEYRRAWTSTREAETAVEAAEENYRAQLERWKQGAARIVDLVDADAEVTRAQTNLVDASVAVKLARAQLERAAGALETGDFGARTASG